MWGNGMGCPVWLFVALTAVAFWALVIFGIVALFRGTDRSGAGDRARARDSRQILDERFARSEIDAEEYHSRQSLLPPVRRWPGSGSG